MPFESLAPLLLVKWTSSFSTKQDAATCCGLLFSREVLGKRLAALRNAFVWRPASGNTLELMVWAAILPQVGVAFIDSSGRAGAVRGATPEAVSPAGCFNGLFQKFTVCVAQ